MLNRKDRKSARFFGLILRMLMTISGGIPSLIEALEITGEKKTISIGIPQHLVGVDHGVVERRIEAIAPNTSLDIKYHYI